MNGDEEGELMAQSVIISKTGGVEKKKNSNQFLDFNAVSVSPK